MGASPMPGMSGYPGVGFPAGMIPPGQFAKTPGGPLPGSFLALAQTAMKAGKEREALQYLCAHYAVHGGDDLAEKMNWVDGLKRPALAVRIGVGIVFSAPNDFRGDPQPVGRMALPNQEKKSRASGSVSGIRISSNSSKPDPRPRSRPMPMARLFSSPGNWARACSTGWTSGRAPTALASLLRT
jgi:hypothetical protein